MRIHSNIADTVFQVFTLALVTLLTATTILAAAQLV